MQKQSDKFTFPLLTVLAALSLVGILVVLLTSLGKVFVKNSGGTPYSTEELVAERLTPYGRVNTGNLVSDVVKAKAPEDVYSGLCASCHDTGLNDAPLVSDKGAWEQRLAERGIDGLHNSSINGRDLMPAKGGDPRLTDDEVKNTVYFMLEQSGIEVARDDVAEEPAEEEAAEEATEESATEEAVEEVTEEVTEDTAETVEEVVETEEVEETTEEVEAEELKETEE